MRPFAASAVLCAMLSGCANSSAQPKTRLRMLTLLVPPARDHMNAMLREFAGSHPGIEVLQETAPGRGPLLMERLRTQMVTGNPPDMFWLASGAGKPGCGSN